MSTASCLDIRVGGKFVLMKKIGEGAFGAIYVAQTIGSSERVAVKLVISQNKY